MIRQLGSRGFELAVLNLSRVPRERETGGAPGRMLSWCLRRLEKRAGNPARLARLVWRTLKGSRRAEIVFFHTGFSAQWIVMTFAVWLVSRVARRPLALRFAGGDMPELLGCGPLVRFLADRTFLRCPLVYVQTRRTLREFGCPANFRWLPNTRDIEAPRRPAASRALREGGGKLVFASRLRMDKGLAEALEACRGLPGGCHLSVFGPVAPDTDLSLFDGHPGATYGGVLEPAEMVRALREHDLLLFPSYYGGEGYPGIIVEAFQCGVPVVAARWRDVPELVRHEENGLLVEPGSAASLRAAVVRLLDDPGLHRRLCEGAARTGAFLRSAVWFDRCSRELRGLCGEAPVPGGAGAGKGRGK